MSLSFEEYQEQAMGFRLPSYSPEAAVLGFLSESGEVASVFQKLIRGDYNQDVAKTKLQKELGDCLWGIAAIAYDNGWYLSDIAVDNIDKLTSRRLRDTLKGSGDDR